jgi:hypothetical protein
LRGGGRLQEIQARKMARLWWCRLVKHWLLTKIFRGTLVLCSSVWRSVVYEVAWAGKSRTSLLVSITRHPS